MLTDRVAGSTLPLMALVWFIVFVVFAMIVIGVANKKESATPQAVAARAAKAEREKQLMCPHCQQRGGVSTAMLKKKGGISGGKATGAILTGGVSLLATGLARKGWVTRMSCRNCGMVWEVAA